MLNRYLLLLFGLLPFGVLAQSPRNVTHQNLQWVRYNNQLTINEKWAVHSEVDNRMFLSPFKEHHLVTRSNVRYSLSKGVEIGAGITYALQHPQDPNSASDLVVPELRPQQDLTLKQDLGKLKLNHRYQLEERFIRKSTGDELEPGYRFNFRARYRLQLEVSLWKGGEKELKAIAFDEVMLNFGKQVQQNVFDQNRIYGGLRWSTSPRLAMELGYMKWYQQRPNGTDFYNRNIYRLSIFHKLKLSKHDL
ncbi:DUF2490 domain-containing protein [Pontibacter harenae]|uniref:DUF2490 domain-containing protein n=1 Tax=Pontibacter harenae TaxID=2894083 RepID=UPI001E56FB67|nr:DUF2490 domain-containing protein [Pontibacter harenae]MCC9166309.1 DUF2490 domain-containing protein [Pontibacter harenae]